jgi:hypothetical protein
MPRPSRKPAASGPKSGPRPRQIKVVSTPEWAAWVAEGAAFCRTDVAKLIDAALVLHLKHQGFPKKPPPRI